MGRWGHDSDDDSDGKPIRHLVRANQARQRTRLAPKPATRPAKKEETKPRSYEKPSARTLMDGIRQLVLDDPELRPDEIRKELKEQYGENVSVATISRIKNELRATLRFLDARGHLKRITLKKGDGAAKR